MGNNTELELQELKKEVEKIKARNKRVEADKAWETSWARAGIILLITYIFTTMFFLRTDQSPAYLLSLEPTAGFTIGLLSFGKLKSIWLKRHGRLYQDKSSRF